MMHMIAAEMQEEIRRLTNEGKTHDQIIEYYLAKYGSQEVLSSPLDKGFSRLAWMFPYLVGATSAVARLLPMNPRPPVTSTRRPV